MATHTRTPYGSWPSPVTTDVVLSSAVNLVEARVSPNKDCVGWLEGRPEEKGRNALVVLPLAGGEKEEVLPETSINCRTRVHEYGGGSWAFEADGNIVFSSIEGPAFRVKRESSGKWNAPEQITPESDVLRFADFAPHPSQPGLTLAVVEDHTADAPSTVVNTLALLSPGKKLTTLAEGNDFYSAPRWSPSGKYVSWITWVHPDMPWESSELWVAEVNPSFTTGGETPLLVEGSARKVAGEKNGDESVSQPRWAQGEEEKLVFLSDRTGFYELYEFEPEKKGGEVKLLLPEPAGADVGGPDWLFGQSTHGSLSSSEWISSAPSGSLRITSLSDGTSSLVDTPYAAFEDLQPVSSSSVVVIGKPSIAPAVVALLTFAGGQVKEQVLARSSTASVDTAFIPEAEKITFPVTSFPDSKGVGHALYYPPSSGTHAGVDGTLPPLIARCHGGPTASARRGLDWLVAFFCSRGFAFLDVDYGGSTGYGKDYRNRLRENWGVVDVKDTIEAVEYLVKEGKVDKEKVAITGGSAGAIPPSLRSPFAPPSHLT
ncbi:hypothetical protein JCM6882_009687, partial [Rhodosporidiobolus microsporus]